MGYRLRALLGIVILAVLIFAFRGVLSPAAAAPKAADPSKPVIFFDLGNVLIDTTQPANFHYVVGAQDYLNSLVSNGFTLGLISNIPESWGATQDEKFAKLKAYVAQTWTEPEPFPWTTFKYVLLPPSDALRKPNPYLFNEAMGLAGPCAPVYEGETPSEISAAQQAGFFGYLITPSKTPGAVNFAALAQLFCRPRPTPSPEPVPNKGAL